MRLAVSWSTKKASGRMTNTSRVAMASGVIAMRPSVLVSNFRCMKYIATMAAFTIANAHRNTPTVSLLIGM